MTHSPLASLVDAQPLRTADIPGNPSVPTRHRWVLDGVLAPSGQRVRLQAHRIGGRLYVTPEAVARFIHELSTAESAESAVESPDEIQRRSNEARRALDSLGI